MTGEAVAGFIFGIIVIIGGLAVIASGIYNMFVVPNIPNSKKWAKTKAKITGTNNYMEKTAPSRHRIQPAYVERTEKEIIYMAEGKIYNKTVSEDHSGTVHLYYKKSNPNYFKTARELKKHKRDFNFAVFIVVILFAALLIWLGTMSMTDFIESL